MRVGIGYDIHRLAEGRHLMLGGVQIPHHLGLVGHSDADVVLHAISDAILGAAALGDIGRHFPDNNPQYKNISSLILLKKVVGVLQEHGYCICQVDTVIIAEQPQLWPFIPKMRERIADALELGVSAVSLKAKTNEGLGQIGAQKAVAAYAVATIKHA